MVIAAHVEPVAAVGLLFEAHEEKRSKSESVEEIIHLSHIALDAKKQSTPDSGVQDHI